MVDVNNSLISKENLIKELYSSINSVYKSNIEDSISIFTKQINLIIGQEDINITTINQLVKKSYNALNNKDYVLFADLLEFEWIPWLIKINKP